MRLIVFVFLFTSFSLKSQTQIEKADFVTDFDFKWTMRAMQKCGYNKLTPQQLAQDIIILRDVQKTDCVYEEVKRVNDILELSKSERLSRESDRKSLDCSVLNGEVKKICNILK